VNPTPADELASWLIQEAQRDHDYVEWEDAYLQALRQGRAVFTFPVTRAWPPMPYYYN
jgi:hypothetical protein